MRTSLRRYLRAIRPHNLVSSAFPDPEQGGWDLVFCRNVIIYFDTPTAQAVLGRLAEKRTAVCIRQQTLAVEARATVDLPEGLAVAQFG